MQGRIDGCWTEAITLLVGKQYGSTGMMAGYFVITLVGGLGWGSWIFQTKRLEWHEMKYKGRIE